MPGGAIAMARVLYDGLVEYEDGKKRGGGGRGTGVVCRRLTVDILVLHTNVPSYDARSSTSSW